MNQLEENNEEKEWRERLRDAEFNPPNSLWERIEAQLDEEEKKRHPLLIWWNGPARWIAAASVAALLVTGAWLLNHRDATAPATLAKTKASSAENRASEQTHHASDGLETTSEVENGDQRIAAAQEISTQKKVGEVRTNSRSPESTRLSGSKQQKNRFHKNERSDSEHLAGAALPVVQNDASKNLENTSVAAITESPEVSSPNIAIAGAIPDPANANLYLDYLSPLDVRNSEVHFQRRYVHFQSPTESAEIPVVKKAAGTWVALNATPGSFNPNLQMNSTGQAATYNYVLSQSSFSKATVTNNHANESRLSYSIMAQTGKQISKHWSVESGISYMQGNSGYHSSGILKNLVSGQTQNSLDLALTTEKNGLNYSSDNTAFVEANQMVANNYQFFQVPLQAGYTILPGSKLNYSLLAGMVTNIFLQNDFGSSSGQSSTITAGDDTYRQVNWSGSTGLRINYRMSKQWNLNLTGSYQRALLSNFKQNSTLKSHPEFLGLGWGLKYSF